LMPGRRWSDGLHQAVEAKEGLRIREEHQTLATITFQNYFRLYEKLAGMTGTALTEAGEFSNIYKLDVAQVPTNKPKIRADHQDLIYLTEMEKYAAIARDIVEKTDEGRPVLVGTISIQKSERISQILSDPQLMAKYLAKVCETAAVELDKVVKKRPSWMPEDLEREIRDMFARPAFMDDARAAEIAEQIQRDAEKEDFAWHIDQVARYADVCRRVRDGIAHNVLNAKFHKSEAEIVAQAGAPGAITIATNMAGRGTDILLGGNPEALARAEVGIDADEETYRAALQKHREACNEAKQRVLAAGGLHIIGSERHEARRIDNQLRGRAG